MKHALLHLLEGVSTASSREPDEPIRCERFSIERLEQHAESLAVARHVRPGPVDRC